MPETDTSPLVSVIIPAYNTAPYIHRAIESCLRQTHRNVEVLVIDDGSTDDTLAVARSYEEKDGRIRVFTQENGGVSVARNAGIREAKGEYLVFLDSDDWMEDDAVEVMLEAQAAHPDCFVAAKYCYVKPENFVRYFCSGGTDNPSRVMSITEVASSFSGSLGASPDVCGKLFRSELVRKNDIRFWEGKCFGEDGLFMFKYLHAAGSFFYLNKYVVSVLSRPESVTRSGYSAGKVSSVMDIYRAMSDCPGNTPEIVRFINDARNFFLLLFMESALKEGIPAGEIRYLREKVRPSPFAFPRFADSLKKKIWFLCKEYPPVPVSRFLVRSWHFVKKVLRR